MRFRKRLQSLNLVFFIYIGHEFFKEIFQQAFDIVGMAVRYFVSDTPGFILHRRAGHPLVLSAVWGTHILQNLTGTCTGLLRSTSSIQGVTTMHSTSVFFSLFRRYDWQLLFIYFIPGLLFMLFWTCWTNSSFVAIFDWVEYFFIWPLKTYYCLS